MENLYLGLIAVSLFFYTHIALTYIFSVKYLGLLEEPQNYHLLPMAGSFALVSSLTYLYYSTEVENGMFSIYFNLLMLAVMMAKCFYFHALRKHLKARLPVDRVYVAMTLFYALASIYFMADSRFNGMASYFDLSKPEMSGLTLRERLLPYELNKTVKILFLPNYLLGFVFYFYLGVKAFQRREKLICFGLFFTIASILYTNSYHLFNWRFWIPLNIVADLFEMLRLHWVQRSLIASKVDEYNQELALVNSKLSGLEARENDLQVFRHDLRNDLYISGLNIQKAKLFLKKSNFDAKDLVLRSLDQALSAQQMAAEFIATDSQVSDVHLSKALQKVCALNQVPLCFRGDSEEIYVRGPRTKLESVLVNLVKNAKEANRDDSDFAMEGWVEVAQDVVHFKIKDSGQYKKIKDPGRIFSRGFSTKEGDGRGLGLYSVVRIMKKLGGEASLENSDGYVCFCLSFPKSIVILKG